MDAHPFYIGGQRRTGKTQQSVRDQYTGQDFAAVSLAGPDDAEAAISSALESFGRTSRSSSYERSSVLRKIADALIARREEIAQLITREAGKPITFSRGEVDRAAATFAIASEEANRNGGEILPLDLTPAGKGRTGLVRRVPTGPVLCITPFNFPLNLVAHKLAPAIAVGAPFILKPAPQTPLTALLLAEVLLYAGLDPGAVNVLPTTNEVAEQLVRDDRLSVLSFTGSAAVGWKLKSIAGKKKVLLELGGNAASIVDISADLPHAAQRCALGAFASAGQVCIKVQRIILLRAVADEFQKHFLPLAASTVVGDPKIDTTVCGPLISMRDVERVESWVNESVAGGATILTGGRRDGVFYFPTVLSNVKKGMRVCDEEIFGPVVTIDIVDSFSDAIVLANDSRYGLQAGVFTNDLRNVQYAYQELQVGGVIINDAPTFRVDNMPYGGMKDSGLGREGVRSAMNEMTEPKLLVL